MRVTEHYNIPLNQAEVDFVDVRIDTDNPLFIDPQAFLSLPSPWAHECVVAIQNFFQRVLDLIIDGAETQALRLLSPLGEPNDTHLGMSKGKSNGSGVGEKLAKELWEALSRSKAVTSGLLQDLEDTALLVKGISKDRISDVTTNIIREKLLEFTVEVATYYDLELVPNVPSGPTWISSESRWDEYPTHRLMPNGEPLLLIPKSIARRGLSYKEDEYYNHHVLNYLYDREMNVGPGASGSLIKVVQNKNVLLRGDVRNKYGYGKNVNLWATVRSPEMLDDYRRHKRKHPPRPLDHDEIAEATGGDTPDWNALLESVTSVPSGRENADLYHRRVEGLLTATLHPHLVHPKKEFQIHEGRKRIDITYANSANAGFFAWLGSHYPCAFIFVECKNYSGAIGNHELDQLAGRFSPMRGKVGLLVYRGFGDKEKVRATCRDTAKDQRGFMIALDDDDLRLLVEERSSSYFDSEFSILQERFNELIN